MRQELAQEVAVFTGSDSGVGQATAIAFAKEGADVAVAYMHEQQGAEKTAHEVAAAGRKAILVHLDQRDPKSAENLFRQTQEASGTPTILVNDAGVDAAGKPVKDMSLEEWDDSIRTNLYGPFFCCKQFINGLDGSNRHGTIINITSVHQEIPRAGAAGYDSSKGALRNLSRTLALELAEKNINLNNIAPVMVLTPFSQKMTQRYEKNKCNPFQ